MIGDGKKIWFAKVEDLTIGWQITDIPVQVHSCVQEMGNLMLIAKILGLAQDCAASGVAKGQLQLAQICHQVKYNLQITPGAV